MAGSTGETGPGDVVVVGTGQAGLQVAASLRDNGFKGCIRLVGDEPGLPYQRPPLSKGYLTGKSDRGALDLRSESFFAQFAIDLCTEQRVVSIDRVARRIALAGGATMAYDHLVLATGARNRPLAVPGAELAGVLQLRSTGDADVLRDRLADVKTIVIVGAGFIGLEIAALARSLNIDATVIEATSRPMSRALSEAMSSFFRDAHEKAGVRFVFDASVARINGDDGRATSVETRDGRVLAADLVLVGVGVAPNSELAADAGLAVDDGIVVDAYLTTSDAAISAIGDCAAYPQPFADGRHTRLESVQNAVDQARCVAARLTGRPSPYYAVPWFWSEQGPLKLQIAGLTVPHAHSVVRGEPTSGAFSVFCFRDDRLLGVESVNRPADHMVARKLLHGAITLAPDEAADPAFDLKARANAAPVAG